MWESVIQQAIVLAFAIVTPVLMLGLHKIMSKVTEKMSIDNAEKYTMQVNSLVTQAIAGVEQVAKTALSKNQTVKKGTEKLDQAIAWINGELARLGMEQIDPDKLALRIEAVLAGWSK